MNKIITDVSIIIPIYNSSKTLGRALESIVFQELLPNQVIIIDDGSNDVDVTRNIINKYMNIFNVIFYACDKNYGPSHARNIGINIAESKYIAFLDADDFWHKDKLNIQLSYMEKYNARISAHLYMAEIDNIKEWNSEINDIKVKWLKTRDILIRNRITTPSVIVERKILKLFHEDLNRAEDMLCWLETMFESNIKLLFLDINLAGGVKPVYGHSGLSKNIRLIHKGILRVYKILYTKSEIGIVFYLLLKLYEKIKYLYRKLFLKIISYNKKDSLYEL